MEENNEPNPIQALDDFAANEKAFEIKLSGFNHLSKRTVFVDVSTKQVVSEFSKDYNK